MNEHRDAPTIEHVSVRDGYDRWAEIYDDEDNPLIAVERQHLAWILGDVRGEDVLDAGCGTGRHSIELAAAGANVSACDLSPGMLARARAKPGGDRVRFFEHDLHKPLPIADRSIDLVISGLVLEHIRYMESIFREFRRVIRPTGHVIISTLHPAMMLRGISARFTDPASGRETRPHSHPHQVSDYVMAALKADLHIKHLGEYAVDDGLAARSERARKYLNWPILLVAYLSPWPVSWSISHARRQSV
ncbi:MAG: class I SAM-dependent methyltransferase [Phycisphaerae bacterium]